MVQVKRNGGPIGVSKFLPVQFPGKKGLSQLLIDSGSSVTVLSKELFDSIPQEYRRMGQGAGGGGCSPPPPSFWATQFFGQRRSFFGAAAMVGGGCFSIFRRADDVTRTMSKEGWCL